MKKIYYLAAVAALFMTACNDNQQESEITTIDFENVELQATSGTYSNILWGKEQAADNGSGSNVFDGILYSEAEATFGSYFTDNAGETWGHMEIWGGFAFSSNNVLDDTEDPFDYRYQFSVYAPQTSKFAIGYDLGGLNGGQYERPFINFPDGSVSPVSVRVANSNKAYHYCTNSSVEDFYFTLIISGYNGSVKSADDVKVDLTSDSRVLNNWQNVDLSKLGIVDKLVFTLESNDSGEYGMNVPAFFCIDDLKFKVPLE